MPGPQAPDGSPPREGDAPALEFAGLYKHFGPNVAVDHIDLRVPRGSFFGLVGPNGAGKTTSLSMAVGLLRPDGGTVRIFGRDVWSDPVAAKTLSVCVATTIQIGLRRTGSERTDVIAGARTGTVRRPGAARHPMAEAPYPAPEFTRTPGHDSPHSTINLPARPEPRR
jgi:ABC-2 type transport system ATP-binding protein